MLNRKDQQHWRCNCHCCQLQSIFKLLYPLAFAVTLHKHVGYAALNPFLHLSPLLPYQADFEEELHSWLQGEESDGRRVAETQTTDNTLSEPPPGTVASSPSPTQGGSLDFSLVNDQGADVESDGEEPSTSAIQPRRSDPVRPLIATHL